MVSGLIVRGSNCREQSSTDLQDSPSGPISWSYSPIVLELIFATNKTKLLILMIVIKDIAASLSRLLAPGKASCLDVRDPAGQK